MKIYNNKLSPNARRVQFCAAECNVSAATVEIDFTKGEHKAPAYLAKNPMGKIPTFEDADGFTLWESPAICYYFAEKYPEKKLMPTDARAKADMMRWMFWNASHLEPAIYKLVSEKMIKPMLMKQPTDEAKVAEAMTDLNRYAPVLNGQLEGKTWIMGNNFTLADITLAATIDIGTKVGLDLAQYTHINAWYQRITARDGWKKSN